VHSLEGNIKTDLWLIDVKSGERLKDGTWVGLIEYAIRLDDRRTDLKIQVVPVSPVKLIFHCEVLRMN
jgi:hypothetical protein